MDHVKESNCRIKLDRTLVNNLRFVDNIGLVDEDSKSLQKQLEKTRALAEQADLIVNVGKTKIMLFSDRKIEQERGHVRISWGSNNPEQQLLRGNKKTNRESRRNHGIPGTCMKWEEANYSEQAQNSDNMCLQRTLLCLRNRP